MNIIESDPIELHPVDDDSTETDTYTPTLMLTQQEVHNILNCADFAERLVNGDSTLTARGIADE
jgi:hypothetical protein